MLKCFVLLSIFSLVFAIPGSFKISFARSQVDADSSSFLSDYQLVRIGSDFNLSSSCDAIFRCGFGSFEASVPSYGFNGEGRIWTIGAGVDYLLHSQSRVFMRGTSGLTYLLRDYDAGQYNGRHADGYWSTHFSIGIGSKFDLDFMPIVNNAEFLLSAEYIDPDVNVLTGEIGFGI